MAIPTFVAAGAKAAGTGAVTPALPSGIATDDILLLFCETADEAVTIPTPNGGTWAEVADSPQSAVGGTRLTVFWSRYNGTQGNPTTNDPGDHICCFIAAFRGCFKTGNPWNVTSGGNELIVDTSASIGGDTTTVNDCLVVAACTAVTDTNTSQFSAWANSDLSSVGELSGCDLFTNAGNGGGVAIATGGKASPGVYGPTTATLANVSTKAFMTIALRPVPTQVDKTHTTNALLKATLDKTHTTNTLLKQTNDKTHTTNSLLKSTSDKQHTTDALIKTSPDKTHTTDSFLTVSASVDKTHNADSLLKATSDKTHNTDSLLRATSDKQHTTDALLKSTSDKTHTTNSLLKSTSDKQHTTDALLKSTSDKTHTTNSLLKQTNDKTHTTNATLKTTPDKTYTTDAFLTVGGAVDKTHITDALFKATIGKQHNTDSFLVVDGVVDKTHTTDVLLIRRSSRSGAQFGKHCFSRGYRRW